MTRRRQRASKRSRNRPTALDRNSHQSVEPTSTPSTIVPGASTALRPARVPNTAMKEKMVAGLDKVSTKVVAAPSVCLRS